MFGDYEDDGEVRELEPTWGTLPKKLLVNVVQVSLLRDSLLTPRLTFFSLITQLILLGMP